MSEDIGKLGKVDPRFDGTPEAPPMAATMPGRIEVLEAS